MLLGLLSSFIDDDYGLEDPVEVGWGISFGGKDSTWELGMIVDDSVRGSSIILRYLWCR